MHTRVQTHTASWHTPERREKALLCSMGVIFWAASALSCSWAITSSKPAGCRQQPCSTQLGKHWHNLNLSLSFSLSLSLSLSLSDVPARASLFLLSSKAPQGSQDKGNAIRTPAFFLSFSTASLSFPSTHSHADPLLLPFISPPLPTRSSLYLPMPFLQHPSHAAIIHTAAYIQMSMTLSQASFLYCPLISGRDDGICKI